MFIVQLFSAFNGWAPLVDGEHSDIANAREQAQLYRIEASGKRGSGKKPRPVRIVMMSVVREWAPDEPIEI